MRHSAGKGPIWSFLETKIQRKIREMVKKPYFGMLGHQKSLCLQNIEKVTPMLYSHSILHGNKGPIWSISVAATYSECKAM